MKLKRHVKAGIRMIIEADGNITTLIIRASKAQILAALDKLLPDDEEPLRAVPASRFNLPDEK